MFMFLQLTFSMDPSMNILELNSDLTCNSARSHLNVSMCSHFHKMLGKFILYHEVGLFFYQRRHDHYHFQHKLESSHYVFLAVVSCPG